MKYELSFAGHSGLGDFLILTPICRYLDNCVFVLDENQIKLAPLLKTVAEVEYRPGHNVLVTDGVDEGHVIIRKMKFFGLSTDCNCIPKINISNEIIDKANLFTSRFKNPVIIKTNARNIGVREYNNTDYWQELVNFLVKQGMTPIQTGQSGNLMPLFNVIKLIDLPLLTLAGVYANVKKYIGLDTGDFHLMLSVGGKTMVLYDDSREQYQHDHWIYTQDMFYDEPSRTENITFNQSYKVFSRIDFLR